MRDPTSTQELSAQDRDLAHTMPLGPRERVATADVAEIVGRYQAGDSAALAEIHDRLAPIILHVLRPYRGRPLPGSVTYQDLTQQAWIILAELAARWQPSGSFVAYFFHSFPRSIQRYLSLGGSRSGRGKPVLSVPHDDLMLKEADGDPDPHAQGATWDPPLETLEPGERKALIMHVVHGRDFTTIGRELRVSRSRAHRLYRSAVEKLGQGVPDGREEPALPVQRGWVALSDEERLIASLHRLGGQSGLVAGRRRIGPVAGIKRERFTALMAELEAAGAIVDRGPTRGGRLADRTPAEALSRLAAYRESAARHGP